MTVTPDQVLALSKPTKDFLCGTDSKYDVQFLDYTIRDYDTKDLLFDVKGEDTKHGSMEVDIDYNQPFTDDSFRRIKYTFSDRVLCLPLISTALTFKVGEQALANFRMIERHYFQDKLIKSFDFTFGFCIPGSTNTWEAVYDIPALDHQLIEEMIRCPYETKSDSFYFVGDELIMHNKASYKYVLDGNDEDEDDNRLSSQAESKKMCIRNGMNPDETKTLCNEDKKCDDDDDIHYDDNVDNLSKAMHYARLRDETFVSSYEDESKYDDYEVGQGSRWSKDIKHFEAKD